MIKIFLAVIILHSTIFNVVAEEYRTDSLLVLDNFFSHHVFVAEKSSHKLFLYKNNNGIPQLIKSYQMATGKKSGNKLFQGDHRTPEGIYQFTHFIPKPELMQRYGKEGEIYGIGAFVMDFPNPIDSMHGKTGGGIWLHSTNDETRIEKGLDSRGCLVVANEDLKDISRYIELNRSMIIVIQEKKYLPLSAWSNHTETLHTLLLDWSKSWSDEQLDQYISFYHPEKFRDRIRGNYNQFKAYKKAVFSGPGKPTVNLKNITILKHPTYAVITFVQDYQSNTINDVGKKILYLVKDDYYHWKIVAETWTKAGLVNNTRSPDQIAFEPSMRFFDSDELGDK